MDQDGDLVARAKHGDSRAFEALVRRHQAAALRVAYSVGGGDAEDSVQEAFVKAYRNLHRFRDGAPFRPWVLRIVANEASNARRSAGRRVHLAVRATTTGSTVAGSPEEDVLVAKQREQLVAAMATLPERDRLVLAYRWFAELSEAEMADALGCRPGTVKSRLSRAHERLRAALAEDGAHDG